VRLFKSQIGLPNQNLNTTLTERIFHYRRSVCQTYYCPWGRGSSVGTETTLRVWQSRDFGSILHGGKSFFFSVTCPERLWFPHSSLCSWRQHLSPRR